MLCHFTVDLIPKLRDPEGSRQPAEGNPPGSGGRELHPLSAVAVDPSVALNNDAEDVDEFDGFSETQSRYDGGEVEIDEEDEKVMAAFMSTKSGRSSHWRTSSFRGSKRRKRRSLLNNLSLNWIVASLICIRGYTALRKSVYKPAAFFKGVLLSLCQSGTCTLQEAVIIGSIIQKVSIPPLHSTAALMKLAELDYCGTTSYFINPFLGKKYALPYRVLDVVVAHFMRCLEDTRIMPVIWHQLVLAFVQR
uniref:Bystin n=1 Tax=Musa acuminata subsp. malaccensis TaxID=214687 RepID=A0A804HM45_MUSAM